MDQIRRRGFMGGLAAMFGLGVTGEAIGGDVADPIDGPHGIPGKAKGEDAPPATRCDVGDIITIEFQGMRCEAIVADWNMTMPRPSVSLGDGRGSMPVGLAEYQIQLNLISCGEVTRVPAMAQGAASSGSVPIPSSEKSPG